MTSTTTSSGSVHVTYREDLRECLYYDADSSSDELSAILLNRRKQELSKKGLPAEDQSEQAAEEAAVMEKLLRYSPDSQRIEQLRDTVGDFGLALFAPLLNLGGEHSSEDSDSSLISSASLSLKLTTTTKKSVSSLTLRTEPESDHYRSEDDDFGEGEENEHTYLQIVDEPIHLLRACPRILSHEQMQQLREHLPYKLRDNLWERCFAIGLHGDSFIRLLQKCAPHKYTVVVIRTVTGEILGGFASERWSVRDEDRQAAYYGTGQSFVFASHPAVAATAAVVDGEKPTTADNNSNNELTVYKWTGSNDYCQICDCERRVLCMGGVGDFAFILTDDFSVGQTGVCGTFGSPPLSSRQLFQIADFEIYGLAAPLFGFGSSPLSVSTPSPAASARSDFFLS